MDNLSRNPKRVSNFFKDIQRLKEGPPDLKTNGIEISEQ